MSATPPWAAFCIRLSCDHAEQHTCTNETRKLYRDAAKSDYESFVRALHDRRCDVWAQQAHGGVYINIAERACGPDAARHRAHLADQAVVRELWEAGHQWAGDE